LVRPLAVSAAGRPAPRPPNALPGRRSCLSILDCVTRSL
jgi:hypothetical protein